jgi:hypothetical protein
MLSIAQTTANAHVCVDAVGCVRQSLRGVTQTLARRLSETQARCNYQRSGQERVKPEYMLAVCLQRASIASVATLYVRDMPDELYARLRDEARGSRRSIGAAAVEILQAELRERSELTVDELLKRARKIRARAVHPPAMSVADEIRADRER